MLQKEITIPKILHEFHGTKASLFSIVLVYVTSIIISTIVVTNTLPDNFAVWKLVIFVIVVMDIAGGVIANFTNSTNRYYQDNAQLRIPFILLHAIQPILLCYLFPQEIIMFVFMGVYSLICCLVLNLLSRNETQRLFAIFLVIVGITIVFVLPTSIDFLRVLPVFFFLKLILGFSVNHITSDE
jgi:hypothetical protein